MATLLVIKETLKSFYSKYEAYLVPVLKFAAAFISLLLVNKRLGYMTQLNSTAIVLIVALLCSFLPLNIIIVMAAAFSLGHVYTLSWECVIVLLVLYLLMFLLYFRFSPKDTIAVLLTPICFALKIPVVMPLSMGLVGSPASVVSVGCGVIVYYVLSFINRNATAINSLDADGTLVRFRYFLDGIMHDRAMLVAVAAFAVTVIVVYIIRRMPVDHCWTIAMITGALMSMVILMFGDLKYHTNISIMGTIVGSIAAVGIVKVLQFFVFNVDYSRTEHIQFEDDEYYYYVKAVPKMTVAIPDKTVTKLDTRKPVQHVESGVSTNRTASQDAAPHKGSADGTPHRSSASTAQHTQAKNSSASAKSDSLQTRSGMQTKPSGAKGTQGTQQIKSGNTGGINRR
ncbi:MAG: hypothetical protein K2N41_08590 [Lachnospiraceae bacterium]|nr:hypothetical protein [Lachnospiraceae bacterium]